MQGVSLGEVTSHRYEVEHASVVCLLYSAFLPHFLPSHVPQYNASHFLRKEKLMSVCVCVCHHPCHADLCPVYTIFTKVALQPLPPVLFLLHYSLSCVYIMLFGHGMCVCMCV